MRRIVVAAVAAAAAASATGVAQAASATVGSARLGSGAATVTTCGTLSTLGYTVDNSSGNVSSVRITGMPSSCNNGSLWLVLTSSGAQQGSGGPATITKGSATITISPPVPNAGFSDLRILISGP